MTVQFLNQMGMSGDTTLEQELWQDGTTGPLTPRPPGGGPKR
jgi:hypothetical protein